MSILKDFYEEYNDKIKELEENNKKLKAENEQLKAYKNKYYQQTLDDEIKLNELYQVLQEIKEIAEKIMCTELCNNCDGVGLIYGCADTDCAYYQMDKILQKIAECEVNE